MKRKLQTNRMINTKRKPHSTPAPPAGCEAFGVRQLAAAFPRRARPPSKVAQTFLSVELRAPSHGQACLRRLCFLFRLAASKGKFIRGSAGKP
ncbi:hypothetical protein, partial [Bradyrhizobium sp. NBAIM08]|uniref:hypothetical protein n=1 Tax=Bradyrhizobium sp. NBAIM08 TaxID=2793815 RepID=UPI001CD6283C